SVRDQLRSYCPKSPRCRRITARERTHFFAFSAHIMRQVLIDEVRRERAGKRDAPRVTLVTAIAEAAAPQSAEIDLEAIHDALGRLAEVDPALARLVEMRYFSGMTLEDIADVDGISRAPQTGSARQSPLPVPAALI
ncbi:MAG: ECF-type sigma factor, partial [Devosia sp.]